MDLVLWILPKCRQGGGGGGPKCRKLCRRHLSMAPNLTIPNPANQGAPDPVQRGDGSAEPALRVPPDEAEGGADQGDVRDPQQHQGHQAQRVGGELPEEDRAHQARRV